MVDFNKMNLIMEIFDTSASLLGKYGRWLNVRGKRVCFIIWTVCTAYWAVRDFTLGLYSQAFFCIFSIGLNIYGFVNWKKRDEKKRDDMNNKQKLYCIVTLGSDESNCILHYEMKPSDPVDAKKPQTTKRTL